MVPDKHKSQRRSDPSDRSDPIPRPHRLRPRGGYRKLRSFQTATLIYDGTISFCQRFVDARSRTYDQMVQAARSGRQNIAEGSRAGATSTASETRLTNVARASLDELLLDYEDFLRQRHLAQWRKDSPEAVRVRRLGVKHSDRSDSAPYAPWLGHPDPAIAANTLICLIHQANYLLDRQIAALEQAIIEKGGYRENLLAARLSERERRRKISDPTDRSDPTDPSDQPPPACPQCGNPMRLKTARRGKTAGTRFWGCPDYPNCTGTRPLETIKTPAAASDPSNRSDPSETDEWPPRGRISASGGKMENKLVVFKGKEIRRILHNNEWWFSMQMWWMRWRIVLIPNNISRR